MSKLQAQKSLSITRFELTKRILVLAGLAGFMLLSLMVTRSSPRTGWSGVLLFGVMTILAALEVVKVRNHKIVKGEGTTANARTSLIWTGTIVISIFLGLLEHVLSKLAIPRMPAIGLWLATFVSTLAFYPFRGEQAQDFPTFKLWAIYCALMGFVSLGFSVLSRWLN
jgi:hypothetical protein